MNLTTTMPAAVAPDPPAQLAVSSRSLSDSSDAAGASRTSSSCRASSTSHCPTHAWKSGTHHPPPSSPWFIRYRFLNIYSRLPPEPQRKEPEIDLFPDSQDGDSKPGLSNYLDEFLSAIKVFGYLERPVFHELTRTMQTRKLIAGETLLLEEEKGFCLVVDGLVQIFVKSIQERDDDRDGWQLDEAVEDSVDEDDEIRRRGHQGYQLLTEVKNGASMSSLFSILSLFSEDIKLRHNEDMESSSSSFNNVPAPDSNPMSPALLLESPTRVSFPDQRDIPTQPSADTLPKVSPLALEGSPGPFEHDPKPRGHRRKKPSRPKRAKSVHPDILARAMVDTTIAIIPASAFRRLTRVYPKATAHIIQVILTRLQRVTFATAHSYLGLTTEALGLTGSTQDALGKTHNSGDASPHLVSYDSRRQKAVFNNAFGFIDPYDGFGDGDSESLMSMSVTSAGGTSPVHNLRTELQDEIEIVYFPKGSVLIEQGEHNPGLYYVIDGFLDVGIPVNEKGEDLIGSSRRPTAEDILLPITGNASRVSSTLGTAHNQRKKASRRSLYMVKPGGVEGYIGSITSYRSFTDVTAKTDVYVGFLPRAVLERIADRYPLVMLTMAKRLTTVLPRLILHIDFALEWVQVNAGQVIHHQGDESDAIYIVLNGRLRAVLDKGDGKVSVLGEYGQGDSVGRGSDKGSPDSAKPTTSTLNLRTVAVLPVTAGIPVVEFGNRLLNAFNQVGVTNGVTSLHQADILNHLGRHAFSKMGKLKLAQYLADLEERYGMVLYVGDTSVNAPWTQTCIAQADCILLVALAEGSPAIGEYERFLLGMKTTARKELVLLHAERYSQPGLTRQWLKNRMWINGGHHHIQMAFRLTAEPVHPETKRLGAVLKQRVQVIQAEIQKYTSRRIRQTPVYSTSTPVKGDFHRLARRLCGKSVGLVLGGGGARGIAHIGVIKALEEAGIPIDIIGGTSIGSFIGALYARDADVVPAYGRAKKFSGRMASMWRFALDLTYPSASYTTGHEFNRGIFKAFGNSHIEDFWLEFYCNTTNISKSRLEFHSSGYAWRYVRASMSLAGLIPPLCDEGNMLLDGGYVDNLTVARMKSLGADVIFAVDVGAIDDNTPQGYGDSLSGFWALVNRWNPFSSLPNPPTLSEIQARLAYVSSVDALERAKSTPGCLYMRPPIDAFGTLDFAKFDEIYQVGYKFGKEFLDRLKNEGGLPIQEETEEKKKLRRTMAPRRASI
uniref:Lysophospholipase NTE1 n=1 Tax=Coccidioides posadasii RMSCC 3488 TaxID=454284 RepID=A0A0J6F6A2_COCPO|nr:Swiss cheese [Coccidioides posadasii RMSCC 3488]